MDYVRWSCLLLGEGWRISITSSLYESHIIKHGVGVILCVGLYDFLWHGLQVQDSGEVTKALYTNILQDHGVTKTIERYFFNPSRVIC